MTAQYFLWLKRRHPQHPLELRQICNWVKNAESVLEIGSRYGETLRFMAASMKGNKLVVVDLPDREGHDDDMANHYLSDACLWLRDGPRHSMDGTKIGSGGYDVRLFIGDSHDSEIAQQVSKLAPFDVILIDGDHSYEGVKLDWEMYGHMGKEIIFHDINPVNGLGVAKLWSEISNQYNSSEYIAPSSLMGVGKICR